MTVFEPVNASSTYEATVARLGVAIRVGILAPGSKLPPERELAEQLRISRSTLRQALATLTERGHLTAVRGRLGGTFVATDPPLASATPFPRERWRPLLDWRLVLELGTAQIAAERASEDDHERLEAAQATLERVVDADFATYRRADVAFHLAIAECTGITRLIAEATQVQGQLTDLMTEVGFPERAREQPVEEHRPLLEAIRAGDPRRAVAAMRAHLETTEALLAAAV